MVVYAGLMPHWCRTDTLRQDKKNTPRRSLYIFSNPMTAESNFNQSENDKNLHDKTYY